ncbi:hypothetical protein NXS19_006686 [Fusarium pseudograminearum]|uniref:Aminoglycoside phosphotransferase domain-containing protein n=1 Tax=Fusarium pseudograminearum (strain CS3096) TaxID=1028729 RepID=K3VAH9_FUSPC|nr:hypothetical protein FPSE_10654 [Fusarium pseudograminearum CS3096]EKJ69158.1 hypothetical protein FPSE_10654 [Fusarium pseudograminearum CS3096]UZP38870.1 hypothetical protein NXS19_006686 [Fusarium pseudograminearum]
MSANRENTLHDLRIDVSALPDITQPEMDFLDSSFFQTRDSTQARPQLPTPASLFEEYGNRGADVITIEELNLAIKTNLQAYLNLEEAQTLWAIRKVFPNGEVPVPELFGWRKHGDRVFIYMSLVPGETLRQAWQSLTEHDKASLQNQLKDIIGTLRTLKQSPEIIGSVRRGPLQDSFFRIDGERGPLSSIKQFNDWLFAIATRQDPQPGKEIQGLDHPDMYRDILPDQGNVYFSHGDLTLGNIMVSGSPGTYTITGIIDWEQAGWYPDYWGYCKILLGVELDHEWRTEEWGGKITEPFDDIFFAVAEYSLWCCP